MADAVTLPRVVPILRRMQQIPICQLFPGLALWKEPALLGPITTIMATGQPPNEIKGSGHTEG